jgi:hypothetical protein
MSKRTVILVIEAAAWVVVFLLVGLSIDMAKDQSAPWAVLITVGLSLAAGTLVEIWFPGPLTGKRHPKKAP